MPSFNPPSEHVGQATVEELIEPLCVDVAVAVDAQGVLGKILRSVSPYLLAAGLAVKARIVPGAVQGLVFWIEGERIALVGADDGEAHDIAIGSDAAWDFGAELDQRARSVGIRI